MPFLTLQLLLSIVAAANGPAAVEIQVEGLRNHHGLLHACLTQDQRNFPNCERDPLAIRLTAPAAAGQLRVPNLPAGRYAVMIFHDENANHRLDKMLGVPREGFGFSRDPVIRFGAPHFDKVVIPLGGGINRAEVHLQYLL